MCSILALHPSGKKDYWQEFKNLFIQKDTKDAQKKLLEEWEKVGHGKKDSQFYVACFNYYSNLCKQDVIKMNSNGRLPEGTYSYTKPPIESEGKLKMKLKNDETGQEYSQEWSDEVYFMDGENFNKALYYLEEGVKKYPNRLDMRVGIVYLYRSSMNWEKVTTELIKIIDYSIKNNNKWIWTEGKIEEDPKKHMLGIIQSYQKIMYDTLDDNLLEKQELIAETILKYYPDHIESLTSLGNIYIIIAPYIVQECYNKALELYLKAEKIDPKDPIVLSNIANVYNRKKNKEKAIQYYTLALKYAGDEHKEFITQQYNKVNEL